MRPLPGSRHSAAPAKWTLALLAAILVALVGRKQLVLAQTLPSAPADQLKALIDKLSTSDWHSALQPLSDMGRRALLAEPALLRLLSEPSATDRYDVMETLRAVAGKDDPHVVAAYQKVQRDNALIEAALAGDQEAVEKALAAGADVNGRYMNLASIYGSGNDYTALISAVISGRPAIVKLLIAKGADVNAERMGKSALTAAVLADDDGLIKILQAAGAKGDPARIRLVHAMIRAACRGYETKKGEKAPPYPGVPGDLKLAEPIETVIARGGNVNWSDERGITPLMYAANLGLVDNVKTLLAAGADVNQESNGCYSAIVLASEAAQDGRPGAEEVVHLLKAAQEAQHKRALTTAPQ